jgi:hypothetical protein
VNVSEEETMNKTATALTALVIAAVLAAAPAQAQNLLVVAGPMQTQNRGVVADLWLRQISNDQNLDGDHTTYYVTIYRKLGPRGEEHRIVGPRLVGEWRLVKSKGVGPNIADRLVRARFRGDIRYVVRVTHGDGNTALPDNPAVEFALDAGNHVIAIVPEAMQCSGTSERQPGISLKESSHTWLWITVETPGLSQPRIATC